MSDLFFQSADIGKFTSIDQKLGLIQGVSVITQGPALGHSMMVDSQTIKELFACAAEFKGGIKVKMSHSGDVADIVGTIKNFRVSRDEQKLLGDLFLLDETPHRAYILELAEKMPESFGLSVAFAGNTEEIAGTTFARCSDLFSIDLVSTPAANPDGLFSRRFDVWQKSKGNGGSLSSVTPELKFKIPTMNPEMMKEIAALIDEKINAAMTSYEAKLSTLKAGTDAALSNAKALASELAEKSTAEALKQFSKSFGQSPGTASAPSAASAAPVVKQFEDLVRDHSEYSKSKTKAIRDTISKHGTAYENYLSRVQNGKEIILF